MFRAIASDEFMPFGKFIMEFPPVENLPPHLAEVHLITGVNGSGKTPILSVLAAMLGNPAPLQKRLMGVESAPLFQTWDLLPPLFQNNGWSEFRARRQGTDWLAFGNIAQWAALPSLAAFAYSGTAYLADAPISIMGDVPKPPRELCLSFTRPEGQSASLLQAITNLKLQVGIDSSNESEVGAEPSRATKIVRALETAISEITGLRFLFHVMSYPKLTLSAKWGASVLPFDLLPDGLRSLIGWLAHAVVMMDAWLQGKGDPFETEAVFLLDEIETHLHPAWQRKILPAFQKLFPKSQIFVATHSPFLIASLNHGWIHPLALASNGKVTVEKPIPASEGDSYISVVEDIMGIKEWYDPETEKLLAEFRAQRDEAYAGKKEALPKARDLAQRIGGRSMELGYMMGRELSQMDHQLSGISVAP